MILIDIRSRTVAGALLVVAASIAGCSGGGQDRPELVPVSGTIIYKGQPIEGAEVAFWGKGQPRAAKGTTDSQGKFTLSTFEFNDGAVPGEHKITVTKMEPGAPAPATDPAAAFNDPSKLADMYTQQSSGPTGPKSLIPEKYSAVQTTTLKETVTKDGQNQFVLTLTD